jgi:hypothetical protein
MKTFQLSYNAAVDRMVYFNGEIKYIIDMAENMHGVQETVIK